MYMKDEVFHFIQHYSTPFFVGSLVTQETLYVNKMAETLFGCTKESCDFKKIFGRSQDEMTDLIDSRLAEQDIVLLYNYPAITGDQQEILVDLHFGYFNQEKTSVFLNIIPQQDTRMAMALHQINQSPRAEAILKLDETLSIVHCNNSFHQIFQSSNKFQDSPFKNDLVNGFLPEMQANLVSDILNTLETSDIFSTEVKVLAKDGGEKWYRLDLQKRILENAGENLMCFMVNIEKEVKKDQEISLLTQYFETMRSLSDESLYIFDLETRFLHLGGLTETELGMPTLLEGYPQCLFHLIHPDELQNFKDFAGRALETRESRLELRFLNKDNRYQWYELLSNVIYSEGKKPFKILGKIKNIQKKIQAQQEYQESIHYFTVMQELSDDYFYRVEVASETLHHAIPSEKKILQNKTIPNYIQAFIQEKIIHPDDAAQYMEDLQAFVRGELVDITARFSFEQEDYHWYTARGKKIFDEKGDFVEVWGRLISKQQEKEAKIELSLINQYFTAVQNLTDHILFHIDVATKTFRHSDPNAKNFGVPVVIPNFVDVFVENQFIRPEDAEKYREYTGKLLTGECMEYEIQAAVAMGVYDWFHVRSQFVYNEKGEPTEIFGTMENIQERKELELRATQDGLTEVQNIKAFQENVIKELEHPENSVHHALFFIDMDDFKGVNDTYGHQFGDFVLEIFAKRLKNCIRETDMVGRLGGDEFVVYLKGIFHEEMALERANTIFERLKMPIANEKHAHTQGASIGIALIPESGITYETLYAHADKAVYHSKKQGKNRATVYSEKLP